MIDLTAIYIIIGAIIGIPISLFISRKLDKRATRKASLERQRLNRDEFINWHERTLELEREVAELNSSLDDWEANEDL